VDTDELKELKGSHLIKEEHLLPLSSLNAAAEIIKESEDF
jgi:hypothetical protein